MKPTLFLLGLLAATTSVVEGIIFKSGSSPLTRSNRNCDGSNANPQVAASDGTVSINRAANLLVTVPIVLKGTPNAAYNVRVIQIPFPNQQCPLPNCASGGGTLTTNAQGIGNTNLVQAVNPGATGAFVAINKKSDCSDYFTSGVVAIV
ncbi:hypothetical protein N7454_000811 [Penicillium verhagenii]|nr:hypothetical protein N7454_000811 [Penicillium verhagenii]